MKDLDQQENIECEGKLLQKKKEERKKETREQTFLPSKRWEETKSIKRVTKVSKVSKVPKE